MVGGQAACRQHVRSAWQNYTLAHRNLIDYNRKLLIRLKKHRARHLVLKMHITPTGGSKSSCSIYSKGSPMATLFGSPKHRIWKLRKRASSVCRRSWKERI